MLCGSDLTLSGGREHVFGKWLQHEFDLWDQHVVLLNGTSIPYRDLVVPCCTSCNTNSLSKLEETICRAYRQGVDSFLKLEERVVFLWVAKMLFGLLYKELSLLADRATPSKGTIVSRDLLEGFAAFHHLMQTARLPVEFSTGNPWSVFLVRVNPHDGDRFYFHDDVDHLCFMIRLGDAGIIASLYDNGATRVHWQPLYEKTRGKSLEPVQFDELAAMVFYARRLLNRSPKTITVWQDNKMSEPQVHSLPYAGFSAKPLFDEWVPKDYAVVLTNLVSKWGFGFEDLYKPPNQVRSWVFGPDDEVRFASV